jgi:hypothetical protein
MAYELPDPNTQWLSQDEMIQRMTERDAMGRKRYESDPAFRACCESKTGLGTHFADGSSTRQPQGVQRFDGHSGQVEGNDSKGLQFVAREGEIELTGKLIEVKEALRMAEARAEKAQVESLARIKIQKSIEVQPKDKIEGFATQDEMVAAMSSREYKNDATTRAYIEQRIGATKPFTSSE